MGQSTEYDWERIEVEYRANRLSVREISRQYGPRESTIRGKAKRYGWQRDLAAKVKTRTAEKIARTGTRTLAAQCEGARTPIDEQIIEAIATRSAQVVESHRSDINQGRQLATLMMAEVFESTTQRESLQELIAQQAEVEDWDSRRRSAIERAVSLPQRVVVLKDLTATMKALQQLERTAFGIDGKEDDELSYEDRLRRLLDDA